MAREKKDKAADMAIDLLGEAFGVKSSKQRSKSIAAPPTPLLIGGIPYVPQHQHASTVPIPQQPFPTNSTLLPAYPQPSQIGYSTPSTPNPSQQDLERLRQIDAHFKKFIVPDAKKKDPEKYEDTTIKTTITFTKHICANCSRLRSKKYHKGHPIKPGETPIPDFCKRCQRDASSTSSSSSVRGFKIKRKEKTTKIREKKKDKVYSVMPRA
jgi:hypothetical protein